MLALCLLPLAAFAAPEAPLSLQKGDSGAAVKALQTRLIALGLLKGQADGLYGDKTAGAVQAAQTFLRDHGHALPTDGKASAATLALIYSDEAMGPLLDLGPGDKGSRVSSLQARLYDLRLLDALPDGDYGSMTKEAVLAFQRLLVMEGVAGALESGIADHVTRSALFGDLGGLSLRVPQTFDETRPETLTGDDLYARGAVLLDLLSGEILLMKQADRRLYPASTTKIMTLMLALELLPTDRLVTIPREAGLVPKDSSLVPLSPGEQMTVLDLLHGLMLRSGNDAAVAVAVLCSGTQEAFVALMNQRAGALGMVNTHFANPHGYHDPEHYTTARDLARLAQAAMASQAFRAIISTTSYTLQPTRLRQALAISVNTDLFDPASPFYYEGAFGIKSGYTRAAGFCYAGCAWREGRLLLAVVMNCRTRDQAWTDMGRLFDLGFQPR
ncbi:MAG: peptidoglycan-binding protein [Christensenellales bacterium]